MQFLRHGGHNLVLFGGCLRARLLQASDASIDFNSSDPALSSGQMTGTMPTTVRVCRTNSVPMHTYIHTYIKLALEDWCYSSSHYQSSLSHFGLPCSVHVWDKEFSNIQVVEVRLEDLRVPCEWCYKKRLVRSVYLFLQYVDKGTAKVIHHLIKLHGLNVAQ